ncbi:hypothetical protein KGQ19_00740 [Catenulispora sp. NL8]|uniref:DUF1023 domain-containing protein n=1 Tax=Catenulispora pinistramenti TaxID=2705254 RepID=A0ABS5KGI1_9ACTN|nr:alpha/beta hydrolase [Catenulispora pinistramenti]MBS2545386.1 hypothetical protein [Catenulispora pinistramenti]
MSLINDPAITTWMGKSGEAFRAAAGPFPGMLDGAAKAYREVGDAFATFSGKIADIQSQIDLLATASLYDAEEMEVDTGLSQDAVRTLVTIPYRPELETRLDDYAGSSTLGHDAYKANYDKIAQSWLAIGSRRGDLVNLLSELRDAKRIWMNAIESATDSAHGITAQLGASGQSSGDFNERFAAFGGNAADLVLAPQAVVDLDVAELPLPGADPSEIASWWTSLSQAERDKLLSEHPDIIGSLDGIPCVDRDKANRALLDFEITRLQANGSDPATLAVLVHLRNQLNATGQAWRTDNHTAKGQNPTSFTAPMPPLLLLHFDTAGNGHLIMTAGNPDTAQNVVTYVPGLGTTMSDHMIDNDIPHTENLYLQALQDHPSASVASVFWLGYNAPVIPGLSPGASSDITHALDVAGDGDAKAAAPDLTRFLDGLHVTSTVNGPVHYTALGHSYGSLVVGTAAAQPGGIPVDDIIFAGSPGVGVDHASDLHIAPGHVWAGAAANDPVPVLSDVVQSQSNNFVFVDPGKSVDHFIEDLLGTNTHGGWFGQNPAASQFGANVFHVAPGDTGTGGMDAHGEYFDPVQRSPESLSDGSSLSNMTNIIVGDYGKVSGS